MLVYVCFLHPCVGLRGECMDSLRAREKDATCFPHSHTVAHSLAGCVCVVSCPACLGLPFMSLSLVS